MGAFTGAVDSPQIELGRVRYLWPDERSDVPKRICPHCEGVIDRVLSCSCSRDAFFGRAVIGYIMRGPE